MAKHYRIVLISDGQGTFYVDDTPVETSPGKLFFLFPGERYRAVGERLEYFYISFEGARAQDLFRRFGVTNVTRVFSGQEGMIPFWSENLSRASEDNIDIISECVLMYAFSRLTSVRETGGSVAYLMTTYAEENYADSELSLQSLAEEWGYSPKYLSDCFKKRTGLGFSRYLKSLRIKHAVFYMDQGVESVKNVALLCGFQDPLYFSKVFRDTVASMRLDAVLAAGFSISRGDAAEQISRGKVFINQAQQLRGDITVCEGDLISLRGEGRLRVESIDGETRKGRIALKLFRYSAS